MTDEVTESTTWLDDVVVAIEPTMIAIFSFTYNLFNDNGFTAGADVVKLAETWYLTQFAGAAEQVLTIIGLVGYYYALISVNTVWQLVPYRFQLLVMGVDKFDPNEYDD